MVALAQTRLGKSADRVDLRVGDFRRLADTCREVGTVDAVVSTFALHHLTGAEKAALLATAYALLKPNGWLLSGDLIVTEDPVVESLIQKMRVRGIVARAAGQDVRFRDEASTRGSLRQIEEEDNDQPQHLASDLAGLAGAGFQNITVFWRETREVLIGGRKAA